MSLSTDSAYLATNGIRAEGGPHDGKFLDDGHLVFRTISVEGGWYKLYGRGDGGLVYRFEPRVAHLNPGSA